MPNLNERITVDPEICHGKPTVRGLRYPVSLILELLAGGMTREEILADYSDLEPEDITACLAFAARLANVRSRRELPNLAPGKGDLGRARRDDPVWNVDTHRWSRNQWCYASPESRCSQA